MSAALLSLLPASVRRIVGAYVGPVRVDDDTALDALRLDSIDRIGLACELEHRFRVDVPDDDIAEWQTVGCITRSIERLTGLPA